MSKRREFWTNRKRMELECYPVKNPVYADTRYYPSEEYEKLQAALDEVRDALQSLHCGMTIIVETDHAFKDCHLMTVDKDDFKKSQQALAKIEEILKEGVE